MTTLLTVSIPATPHTTLRPNDRTDERTKARHRKTLRQAATLATKNLLVERPELAQDVSNHRLRFDYRVMWEKAYGSRRQRLDGDSALIVLKSCTDGIVDAINFHLEPPDQINDRDIDFAPVVQEFSEWSHGEVLVEIVSLGEVEREEAPVVWWCQAITKAGTLCTQRGKWTLDHPTGTLHLCARHARMVEDGRLVELSTEAQAA
jgi:hypothetical protein